MSLLLERLRRALSPQFTVERELATGGMTNSPAGESYQAEVSEFQHSRIDRGGASIHGIQQQHEIPTGAPGRGRPQIQLTVGSQGAPQYSRDVHCKSRRGSCGPTAGRGTALPLRLPLARRSASQRQAPWSVREKFGHGEFPSRPKALSCQPYAVHASRIQGDAPAVGVHPGQPRQMMDPGRTAPPRCGTP